MKHKAKAKIGNKFIHKLFDIESTSLAEKEEIRQIKEANRTLTIWLSYYVLILILILVI